MNRKDAIREQIALESPKRKPVVKRKRKPMTDEQKAAAAERLAAAREKRAQENPPKYKNISPEVLALPDDDPLSIKNVREWIKTQKDLLSAARRDERAGIKGAIARVANHEGYIRNLQRYIQTGTYTDMFWGEHMQNNMQSVCMVPARYDNGFIKRTHGTWYADIGTVWDCRTMNEQDYPCEKYPKVDYRTKKTI
jgi:thioesterase domain-containing protein